MLRGITERRQHRWFLTRRAVDLLYVTNHQHPATLRANCPRTTGSVSPWTTTIPSTWRARGILSSLPVKRVTQTVPGTAPTTSTRLGPPPRVASRPPCEGWPCWSRSTADTAASREAKMTDFRLPCHSGFYHAVARYGPDLWIPFTYADLHATQRVCRNVAVQRFRPLF